MALTKRSGGFMVALGMEFCMESQNAEGLAAFAYQA